MWQAFSHSLYCFLQIPGSFTSCFDIVHLQIEINKRNRNVPPDVWCRMTVDGAVFKTQESHPFNGKWMSHKFNGAALKCQVAISDHEEVGADSGEAAAGGFDEER
jgi:hypothetical protein